LSPLPESFQQEEQTDMSADNSKDTSRTDWAALATMSDDDIDYSDIPPLTEAFFKNAALRIPASQVHSWVQLDHDIIEYFRNKSVDYKALINQALHEYISNNSHSGTES